MDEVDRRKTKEDSLYIEPNEERRVSQARGLGTFAVRLSEVTLLICTAALFDV